MVEADEQELRRAERMYAQLGYQPLGRYEMWERRSSG
jgi:hypothetical protein